MKNALRIIAIVLAAVILFGAGYGLGSNKGINITVKYENAAGNAASGNATVNTNTTPVQTTAPQQTQAPSSDNAQTEAPKADDSTKTDAPAADKKDDTKADDNKSSGIPSTPEEVVKKYDEVVNAAKKEQKVTIHKTSNTNLECTDCRVGFLTSTVTSLLGTFMKPIDETYEINGGVDSQGKTTNDFILPQGREATLSVDGVESATAAASGDGYVMTIKLKSEKSTYDGTNTVNPVNHESAMIPLNLATLELPAGATISQADMTYPGATIEATVNGDGKLTKIVLALPMEGSGTGGLKSVSLSVGIKGQLDEVYELTY